MKYITLTISLIILLIFLGQSQILDKVKNITKNDNTKVNKNKGNGTYQVGEVVEVYDPIEKAWFPSTILKVQDEKYFIHFTNYDPKWDTWVTSERIRSAGVGNKYDAGPTITTTSTNTPEVKNTTTPANTNTTTVTNTSTSSSSIAISEKTGPTSFPIIYYKDKTLFFRIGDPVIFELDGKKEVYTIADINYNGDIKKMMSFNEHEMNINLNKVELVNGYNYLHFPATISNGTGDKFKEGDMIEILCSFNDINVKYKWEKGLVVSVDGDNYYIYRPGTVWGGTAEYFWHHISEMRAIGSNKTVVMPPEYGVQNRNPNLKEYYKILKGTECDGHNNWEFLWFYRHDFGTFNPRLVLYADKFKTMIDQYNCIYDARKTFPDVGISGYTIESREDVQWEFLQKRNDYIKIGLERAAKPKFYEFTLKVKDGYYEKQMASFTGLEELKQMAKGDKTKELDKCAAMMEVTIDYPWALLDSSYQQGLKKFMNELTVEYKGLEYDGKKYSLKDAKTEAVAKKDILVNFPGSTIIASGTAGDFYIYKNSYDVPTSRAKSVIVIHQNPKFRTCIITQCEYREDYIGGGKYGTGYIYGQLTGNRYLKSCK